MHIEIIRAQQKDTPVALRYIQQEITQVGLSAAEARGERINENMQLDSRHIVGEHRW